MLVPPQPVVPQAPPARGPSRGTIAVIVVLGLLVAALGGVIVARELSAPAEVALEPVATAGTNPFMDSVGTDVPAVRPVANTGGRHSGTTPGLYGGSGDDSSCDRSQLTRYLSSHPDRAAGWASVLGLRDGSSSTISSYVDGLTSVVLRSDTYVTNHGWSDGSVTSWPAVLQAGTAVLVDPYGNPVTRCFCGNPLTAPQSFTTVAYVGPRWSSFTSDSVTIINHQTTTVTDNYTIIDVHTGRGHDRPRGTDGERDRENRDVQEAFGDEAQQEAGGAEGRGSVDVGSAGGESTAETGSRSVPSGGVTPGPTDPTTSTSPGTSTSTTTPSTTSGTTSGLTGAWQQSPACDLGPGPLVFDGSGGYSVSSRTATAGSYTRSGSQLILTPPGDQTSITFTADDAASPTTWTDSQVPACTLTSTSS
ncbi:EGFR-like transmembrane domain-containing protein [Actinomycetospora chibensis]|uniref:DUF6777 domain-containing protein n=1 Tax=Actinomycetospora chibensis TaxID=663606 RepID=A0ABV9RGR0_9PSEU|nr:transmembrane domain-containing protein [Actinomycetospora chibensis]MDD7922936.1 transmembrane domain-containing protein [Actinomycetospora chibensis]